MMAARVAHQDLLVVAAVLLIGSAAARYSCIEGQDNKRELHAPYDPNTFKETLNWKSCWRLYANGVRTLAGSTHDCTDRNDNIHERFPALGWLTAPDRAFTCCEGPNLCNSNAASALRPLALPLALAALAAVLLGSALL